MASNYVKQRQKEKRRRSIYMPFKERPKDNQSKVNKINTYARKCFFALIFARPYSIWPNLLKLRTFNA